jgi:hypothetical protein
MSESTENTSTNEACERVLDYAYGELDAAQAAEFEQHLKDCAKCQRELQMMKRVRSAVKTVLPLIEPPATATGALHAQLLHAAAQRRAPQKMGKMLTFARRVVSHPGYAAAAALLLVGGAVGLQFARGGLSMPPREAAPVAAEAPKPAAAPMSPVVAAPPVEQPGASNAEPAAAADEKTIADKTYEPKKKVAEGGELATAAPKPEPKPEVAKDRKAVVADDTAPELVLSQRSAPKAHHAFAKSAPSKPAEESNDLVLEGKLSSNTHVGKVRDTAGGSRGVEGLDGLGGVAGGQTGSAGGGRAAGGPSYGAPNPYRAPQPKMDAPAEPQAQPQAQTAPRREVIARGEPQPVSPSYAPPTTAAPSWNANGTTSQAAPPPPAPTPAPTQTIAGMPAGQVAQATPTPQKNEESRVNNLASTAETLRRKAEDAANSGRCDEANKLYRELETRYPTYSLQPRDRLPWVKCLRATGNDQMANDLEQKLRLDNNSTNSMPAQQRQMDAEMAAPVQAQRAPAPAHAASPPRSKAKASKKASSPPADAFSPTMK